MSKFIDRLEEIIEGAPARMGFGPARPESEWYPSELQDDIQHIINEALGMKESLSEQS